MVRQCRQKFLHTSERGESLAELEKGPLLACVYITDAARSSNPAFNSPGYRGFTTPCNCNSEKHKALPTITELVVVWSVCSVCTSMTKSKVVGPHIQLDTLQRFTLFALAIARSRKTSAVVSTHHWVEFGKDARSTRHQRALLCHTARLVLHMSGKLVLASTKFIEYKRSSGIYVEAVRHWSYDCEYGVDSAHSVAS